MLARHARELEQLDSAQGEIDALHGLIDAFAQKFKNQTNGSAEKSVPPVADAGNSAENDDGASDPIADVVSDEIGADEDASASPPNQAAATTQPPRRGIPPEPESGEYPRTNFEVFSRAMAKASF